MGRRADGLPKSNQQLIDLRPQIQRQPLLQSNSGALRIGGRRLRPLQSIRNAMDVRVDA